MQLTFKELMEVITEDEYVTAKLIADRFGVSEKTVRNRISELKEELKSYGADVVSSARKGYILMVNDRHKFLNVNKLLSDYIPLPQERIDYILKRLLESDNYVKIDELSDELYINRNIISNEINKIETVLKKYKLDVKKTPHYGVVLDGSEFNKRRFIFNYFILSPEKDEYYSEQEIKLKELSSVALELMAKYKLSLSEIAFSNFVDYLLIQKERISSGFTVSGQGHNNIFDIGIVETSCAREIAEILSDRFNISYSEREIIHISLQLDSRKSYGEISSSEQNFVIRESIDRLVVRIIRGISERFDLDLQNNLDFRMGLNQHLVPLDVRLKYDIPFNNPMLSQIKSHYPYAYSIAQFATSIIEEEYSKDVSEDETGYLALIIQLALEKNHNQKKRNILIICSTGKSSSKLLMYIYKKEFGEYLDNIYLTDSFGIKDFDYTKVDYVFSTIPIEQEIPKPILLVNTILDSNDIKKVKKILKGENEEIIRYYFRKERMLTGIKAKSKDEVIKKVADYITEKERLDEGLVKSIMEREKIESTDFGNLIAVPHPKHVFSNDTIVYVVVLEKPIKWNRNMVQVIIFTLVGENIESTIQTFYDVSSELVLNKAAVDKLIKNPSYENLIQLLINFN